MAGSAGQPDTDHRLLGPRIEPRRSVLPAYRLAARETDRQHVGFVVFGFCAVWNEPVAVQIGGVAEQAGGKNREHRLLQSDEPFIRYTEGQCSLIGMVKPVTVLHRPILLEPDSLFDWRIVGQADGELVTKNVHAIGSGNEQQNADQNFRCPGHDRYPLR